MRHKSVRLDFSDPDMAQALADAEPPEGVKVLDPSTLIQASDPAQILTQIVIEFVPQFSATVLAGWILLALSKRGKKRSNINRKEVVLKEADIVRLIQEQLASQRTRETQWERTTKIQPNQSMEPTPPDLIMSLFSVQLASHSLPRSQRRGSSWFR